MKYILIIFILTLSSCKDKKTQPVDNNPVPYVQVDLAIYPNDPLFTNVQYVGGWMYVAGGINGIVIYRKTEQEFVALERTSPYSPNDSRSKVFVMKDNFTLRDTISDSRWRMFDGIVTQGPNTWPLRIYGTTYDGNVLRIRN